ncbi:cyclopentanol dehydrogenase [Ruminiclostridium hungatei]|uniref:Cyclopentanol dehydrogenase n=1 Tax=Ruminiclostridium hungatei TaxID=48256 RepID=A0A1V4SKW6_RUMHU|nr:oxidoreductase [Ruminiclostridium hungatei]OPX44125.1 cyclopentanol dehydrogenase [Ruminiclostridium hungatei]
MTGKVVFITGASSGIGRSTAIYLNKSGYCVYAGARRVEKMADLKEQGINIVELDVTKDGSMVAAVNKVASESGGIDILVNNAGYGSYGALEDVPVDEARRQFEVNVFGMSRMIQLVLPDMRKKKYGKIINISSIGGKIYEPLGAWYHSAKYAVEGLSDCLRMELKDFGIDVIVIEPGGIKTEWAGIAGDNLLKTSGNSAYGEMARRHAAFFSQANSDTGSGIMARYARKTMNPELIAGVIEKAIRSNNPKTRYIAGFLAKPSIFLRKLLSDKSYDRFNRMLIASMGRMASASLKNS